MLSLKPRLTTRNTILTVAIVIVTLIMVSIAHAQETLKSVDSLIVVDANGKKVGNVLNISDFDQLPTVAFKQDELLFVLNVTKERLQSDALAFESSDCTGTPYLIADTRGPGRFSISPLPSVAIYFPGNTLYVPDSNTSLQEKMIGSIGYLNFPPDPVCTSLDPNLNRRTVIKAIPTVDLSQIFTPPFKVEAGPQDSGKGKDKGKGKGKG